MAQMRCSKEEVDTLLPPFVGKRAFHLLALPEHFLTLQTGKKFRKIKKSGQPAQGELT